MSTSIEDIKLLRAKTSAGMALCKEALEKSNGDMKKAIEYINSRSDAINRLHNLTGAKIGHCKLAFEESGKDFEKAVSLIKERGWDVAIENENAIDFEGILETYVHGKEQKLVSMVEVTCKTDFVARNEDFRTFVHEVVLQIAAMKPLYISKESIPQEKLDEVKAIFLKEVESEGKPAEMAEKIIEGKLSKFFEEKCLLSQKWFKDDSKTIQNLLDEATSKLGEPLEIRRFLIWEFGK
ncbi:MAG: translation elongation factor Ts, elongation factor Ts [candidate division WS6 bacterium GW2011_GWC1_33_20]|uniref:Elongation factor Ts n=2 Tax=Candidatus Dojkabacteria TaxID=74243 RepID=A0A0G0ATN7_9BACT|nr:MAG: translation elongation factor Ts, elongation factor Ts [candidate division WS6 bacterium GW2011_GWC1_33_20]KKP45645.1 MAG: translation elongation factor Ts, elongation factor Ts [candidate division WS6 bacterium GW2011_GWF1_33_233]KKP54811.1 MAG: Elongation factor Ts [candidate division WS6 bacterium GW2011_GWB1_33_6]KKP55002.1 MAG: translation elongation factor Ts, elongation factor Ts [candidate division WS6 bacterium GW2011_WS6_33_547]KKP56802.1 MAG: Elongation factor Ts [candidate d